MHQLIRSSQNPENLSLTLNGILIAFVPIVIGVFQAFNIEVSQTQIVEVVQSITAAISGIVMLIGLVRRVINILGKK